MAINISQSISVNAPDPTDARFGPYVDIAAAQEIPKSRRYIGLTIGIITSAGISEYWWKEGIDDGHLVQKLDENGVPSTITVDTDLLINSENPVENKAITKNLILDTSRSIRRDFSALNGATINVNKVTNPTKLGLVVDFLNAVFYPFTPHTLACTILPATPLKEVGEKEDVTVRGTYVLNNENPVTDRFIQRKVDNGSWVEIANELLIGTLFSHDIVNEGLLTSGKIEYRAIIDTTDEEGDPLQITSNIKSIKYMFPLIIGYSDESVTEINAAEIENQLNAEKAIKVLADISAGGKLIITNYTDLWLDVGGANPDKIRWIAIPKHMNIIPIHFNSGQIDSGDIPSDGSFDDTKKWMDEIELRLPEWNTPAEDYIVVKTTRATSFDKPMTLTFGAHNL